MKKLLLIIFCLVLLSTIASAAVHEVNITNPDIKVKYKDPNFIVKSLKYEPYPLNPGDWFDIWIKVENIGEGDAQNAKFELIPEYPFSASEDLVQEYGLISGSIDAFNNKRADETTPQDNQVVIKYKVKVADNANEGTFMLKISAMSGGSISAVRTYSLPVSIEKTKTKFEIKLQSSTPTRTIFIVSNIGDKSASAVTVSLNDESMVNGLSSAIIGNLNAGEFTSVSFQLVQDTSIDKVPIQISYTDSSGIRSFQEINVPITWERFETHPTTTVTEPSYNKWLYSIAGLILGFIIALILLKRKK